MSESFLLSKGQLQLIIWMIHEVDLKGVIFLNNFQSDGLNSDLEDRVYDLKGTPT